MVEDGFVDLEVRNNGMDGVNLLKLDSEATKFGRAGERRK